MKILIVDDETIALTSVRRLLNRKGFENVDICADGREAIDLIRSRNYDVVLIDLLMPGVDGLQVIERTKPFTPTTEFIMLTAVEDASVAFNALHIGAYDYLVKPVDNERLLLSIERAYERKGLLTCMGHAGREESGFGISPAFSDIVTGCAAMKGLLSYAEIMARSGSPVLITGESGTGKELIARGIHRAGPHPDGPFIAVNMASVPETLFESQFLGHVRGAFTGAEKDAAGYFEQANDGTLFLDEICELPLNLQPKLLRVLEEKIVFRIGDARGIPVNARILSATNQDPDQACRDGKFRLDLLYRLKHAHIHLPALRERGKDVLLLASHFLNEACRRHGKTISGFGPETIHQLYQELFPGNVRELAQWVEQAVLLSKPGDACLHVPGAETKDLPPGFGRSLCSLKEDADVHTAYVLAQTGGDRRQSARILGVSVRQIQRRIVQMKENPRLKSLMSDMWTGADP